MSNVIDGAMQAKETSKCRCAEDVKTARNGRWECLECGSVWHVKNTISISRQGDHNEQRD